MKILGISKKEGYILATFLYCLFHFQNASGQSEGRRYLDPNFFAEEKITTETGLSYGSAIDWLGVRDTQRFNIYYPKFDLDVLKKRPFIMLMHGGGFKPEDDFSNKNQWNKLCVLLAKRGFVTATIDYRVGWNDRQKTWPEYTAEERKDSTGLCATYRAYQDARAALRYFVHNASKFGIDTGNIFIGGRSAGGDLSMECAFYTQRDIDSVLMTVLPVNYHKLFGGIDSSTNNYTEKYRIRGIANMWGPLLDTSMISKQEAKNTAVIMFHGTEDRSVAYKKFDTTEFPFVIYGSYYIAQRYRNLGAPYELHTKLGGGHGHDFSNEFLAEHLSSFFNSVMLNNCKSAEFETTVSLSWKIKSFFESGAWINLIPVLILVLVIYGIIKFRKKRKKTATIKT